MELDPKPNASFENSKAGSNRKPIKRPRKITPQYLHNSGLYYLQRYTASTDHFRSVMTRKINRSCAFHTETDKTECLKFLEDVIIEFTALGYLDDVAYTRGTVFSLRRKGLSARMIQMRMKQKGIPDSLTQDMLTQYAQDHPADSVFAEDEDLRAALILAKRKKIGPYYTKDITAPGTPEARQKLFAKWLGVLGRAGFDYQTCRKVLELDSSGMADFNTFGDP